jgi:glycosyltransferase involved in cell wall biosynthesis
MKIAIFTWGLREGAFANLTAALVRGFWNIGLKEITVIYLYSHPGEHINFPKGVSLVPLGVRHARWAPLPLARFIRKSKPHFLISMPAIINIPAILGSLLAGSHQTKLIISEHATMSYKSYIEHKNEFNMHVIPVLARLLYRMADGLCVNSQCVLDDLFQVIRLNMQHSYTTVIPNPIDIDKVRSYSKATTGHLWQEQKTTPVILSVGRLAKQKNFPLLLRAFAIVRQKINVKLIILGDGPERGYLQELTKSLGLEEHIQLPGFFSNPWSYMAGADVFVLPSEEEAFGLVLVEAMACGIPVIATDAIGGGPRSILENGRSGILVPSQNPNTLADAILKVLSSPDLHHQLCTAGKQRCETFRPENIAQQWILFLNKLSTMGLS